MAKIIEAISPQEIRKKRDVEKIADLESINKIVSTINNRLEYLDEKSDLVYSFTSEGYQFGLLNPVADFFDSAGWIVAIYGDRSRDMGIKISWPPVKSR